MYMEVVNKVIFREVMFPSPHPHPTLLFHLECECDGWSSRSLIGSQGYGETLKMPEQIASKNIMCIST